MPSVWTRVANASIWRAPLWDKARVASCDAGLRLFGSGPGSGPASGSASGPGSGRRALTIIPAVVGMMGVALSTSSTARPDPEGMAEAIALTASGDAAPATLARPVWQTVSMGGQPPVPFGAASLEAQKLNAALPVTAGALRPARPFIFNAASAADRVRAQRCLTQAVYYEAALEGDEGQAAVAQVVLNRVRDPNYPASVCAVVFQGAERVTGCQFSFTCDGALSRAPVGWAWDRARKVADRALAGHVAAQVGTATHYHADYVMAWWAPTLAKITKVGVHIFYRWKGVYGETAAFRQAYSGREPVIDEARFAGARVQIADVEAETVPVASGGVVTGELKTVQIDGQTRVVGVVSLGGRRQPTPQDIAAINERLKAYETTSPPAVAPAVPPPAGVTPMAVEEVGRPGS